MGMWLDVVARSGVLARSDVLARFDVAARSQAAASGQSPKGTVVASTGAVTYCKVLTTAPCLLDTTRDVLGAVGDH